MKKFNIFIGIICSLFLITTASCDQENVGSIYNVENEYVTFMANLGTSFTIPSTETSFDYQIARGNLQGRLELPITAEYDKDAISVPSSVVFEDGSETATLTISLENTTVGTRYPITLSFDSIKSALTGKFKTTISIMRDYVYEPVGKGLWLDGIVAAAYGAPTDPYPVDVQVSTDGTHYRLVNPYGLGVYEYTAEGETTRNPAYLVIDVTDPDNVIMEEQGIGIDWGYGEIFVAPSPSANPPKATFVGKNINFPAQSLAVGERDYNNGNVFGYATECNLELP
ncbi:MAG: hypothetical protein LBF59_10035 [Prevotellaceae bacterium]|nr:hypothetical protein [Prevotellaceae bacterium]